MVDRFARPVLHFYRTPTDWTIGIGFVNFTFLHAADLHLGSPLTGLAQKDEVLARRFALASREAFSELVARAISESVGFTRAVPLPDGFWMAQRRLVAHLL